MEREPITSGERAQKRSALKQRLRIAGLVAVGIGLLFFEPIQHLVLPGLIFCFASRGTT